MIRLKRIRLIFICIPSVIVLIVVWNYFLFTEEGVLPSIFSYKDKFAFHKDFLEDESNAWTSNSSSDYPWQDYFYPTISAVQKQGMMDLLKVFKVQMEKYKVRYFLHAGSLIGAVRHHGMIPWDDDIDILIDSNQKQTLKLALQELKETHILMDMNYEGEETWKWKFYRQDGQAIKNFPFLYPYLDLFFYRYYNETMFNVELEKVDYNRSQIYPLIDRQFDELSLPTPCNTELFLKYKYDDITECLTPSYNHSVEESIPDFQQLSVSCHVLEPYFGFVSRKIKLLKNKKLVSEVLVKKKEIVQIVTYFLPLNCTETYSKFNSELKVIINEFGTL